MGIGTLFRNESHFCQHVSRSWGGRLRCLASIFPFFMLCACDGGGSASDGNSEAEPGEAESSFQSVLLEEELISQGLARINLEDELITSAPGGPGGPIGPTTLEIPLGPTGIPLETIGPGGDHIEWSMDERYSLGYQQYNQNNDGLYDAQYVYPNDWGINLSICGKAADRGGRVFNWVLASEDGSQVISRQSTTCAVENQIRLPKLTKYSLSVEVLDTQGESETYSINIEPKDLLVVTMGDSIASGEGFNRFFDPQCNKSETSGYAEAAREIEERDPHTSVTYLMLACSGAGLENGILFPQRGFDKATGCVGEEEYFQNQNLPSVAQLEAIREGTASIVAGKLCYWTRPNLSQLKDLLMYLCDRSTPNCTSEPRPIDIVFLQAGANDLDWSGYIKDCALQEVRDPLGGECIDDDTLIQLSGEATRLHYEFSLIDQFFDGEAHELISDLAITPFRLSFTDAEYKERFLICAFGSDARIVQSGHDCGDVGEAFGRSAESTRALKVNEVYLGEYPYHIFTDGQARFGGCGIIFSDVNESEAALLFQGGEQLSLTYDVVTRFTRWNFVSGINDQFKFHGYCAMDTWWHRVEESLLAGLGVAGNPHALLHPTVAGHQAIAKQIGAAIDRLKPSRDERYSIKLRLDSATVSSQAIEDVLVQPTDDFSVFGSINRRGSGASLDSNYEFSRGDMPDINGIDPSAEFSATIDDRLTFMAKLRLNTPTNTGRIAREIINEFYSYTVRKLLDGIDDGSCMDVTSPDDRSRAGVTKDYSCTFEKTTDRGGYSATFSISITDTPSIFQPSENIQ